MQTTSTRLASLGLNTIHLNIGLAVGNTQDALQMPQIAVALEQALPGMQITESYIRQSSTERTACIILRWAGTYDTFGRGIMALCEALQQDAIAGKWFEPHAATIQFLIGPKAAEWGGEFNAEFWLEPVPDNAPVDAADALANLQPGGTRGGYTFGMKSEVAGWFERDYDGTGGELLFGHMNPETGEFDGHLHLHDYDGTFALPRPVLVALRNAGVSVDSTFE